MPKAIPFIKGQKYGRWTVVSEATRGLRRRRAWVCRCECGTVRLIEPGSLNEGLTRSCGCLRDEKTRSRIRHGYGRAKARRPEYSSWAHMIQRCANPSHKNYRLYGGRGISVCERWKESFENFLSDMGDCPGPGHSIDRIDVNGNYEPGNCRWADRVTQARNRRGLSAISAFGEERILTAWAEKFGLHPNTLRKRLNGGLPIEAALLAPVLHPGGEA